MGDLEIIEKLTAKSKLTKKDVLELSRKINNNVSRKLGLY